MNTFSMKKELLYIASCLFYFLMFAISCTEEESVVEKAVPGIYIIETSIQAIKDESKTRWPVKAQAFLHGISFEIVSCISCIFLIFNMIQIRL